MTRTGVFSVAILTFFQATVHPVTAHAQATDALTEAQQALYSALRPAAAALAASTADLEAAILEYQARNGAMPADYQLALRELVIDGIPEDGLPHTVRVAKDSFVLLGEETVFAFRRVFECVATVPTEGAMQGVPQVVCDN